ncbi:hypothetical protein B0H15DRAFT_948037 [Mycena belliarum]|uniref:Uncharacterized protein n=1 Tax=Mycena belliarum TaxID=1033014 RepID=A0AAD6UBT8_9AGAR|nr:hypothetical protein B0H15DRAFT_948037 [Mycena belliae]
MIAEAKTICLELESKDETYSRNAAKDDQLEYQVDLAQSRHADIHTTIFRKSQALLFLQSADMTLRLCSAKLSEALNYPRHTVSSEHMTKMMKHAMLSAAEEHAFQTATNVQQAVLASPHVKPIGKTNIAHGNSAQVQLKTWGVAADAVAAMLDSYRRSVFENPAPTRNTDSPAEGPPVYDFKTAELDGA